MSFRINGNCLDIFYFNTFVKAKENTVDNFKEKSWSDFLKKNHSLKCCQRLSQTNFLKHVIFRLKVAQI